MKRSDSLFSMTMVHSVDPKRRTVNDVKKNVRKSTMHYFLKIDSRSLHVCQKIFLQTIGIKYSTICCYIGKHKTGIRPEKNKCKQKNKSEDNKFLCTFFDSLPMLPSHYCRQSTIKM